MKRNIRINIAEGTGKKYLPFAELTPSVSSVSGRNKWSLRDEWRRSITLGALDIAIGCVSSMQECGMGETQ